MLEVCEDQAVVPEEDLRGPGVEGELEGGEAGVVPAEGGVAAEPADPAVAEGVEVADDLDEGLGLVAEDRVAEPVVAGGDGDEPAGEPRELGHERPGNLAEDDDTADVVARVENLAEFFRGEFVLGAEEDGAVIAGLQRVVEAVLHVAEVGARDVEPQRGAEDEADLFDAGGVGRGVNAHALGQVADAYGVVPDAFVGIGIDTGAAAVEGEGDEGLGDPELLGELGLGNLLGSGHEPETLIITGAGQRIIRRMTGRRARLGQLGETNKTRRGPVGTGT